MNGDTNRCMDRQMDERIDEQKCMDEWMEKFEWIHNGWEDRQTSG